MTSPFAGQVSDYLFVLLYRWLAWVSRAGSPRSPAGGWERLAELGIMPDGGGREYDPPAVAGFGAAVANLTDWEQLAVAAVIVLDKEPWLEGEKWELILKDFVKRSGRPLTQAELIRAKGTWGRLTIRALKNLQTEARRLGLMR